MATYIGLDVLQKSISNLRRLWRRHEVSIQAGFGAGWNYSLDFELGQLSPRKRTRSFIAGTSACGLTRRSGYTADRAVPASYNLSDLYLLGDLVGTGTNVYTATPTAVTLTLNKTGSSAWSFSATLSNPPPGSGVTTNVPEPASLTLLGGGLAALSFVRRRKRHS